VKAGAVAALAKVKSMKTELGVWIDHRKAVIASIAGGTERIREVTSNMEKHVRYSRAAQEDSAEDQRDRRFADHLDKYYDEVIACIRGAESILILGPGEAKTELEKRLRNEGLRGRIVGIETVDKMTDGQIAARVRQRFLKSKSKSKIHELKSLPVA
jgi:stalled ribosome rescue protein Dom34